MLIADSFIINFKSLKTFQILINWEMDKLQYIHTMEYN